MLDLLLVWALCAGATALVMLAVVVGTRVLREVNAALTMVHLEASDGE